MQAIMPCAPGVIGGDDLIHGVWLCASIQSAEVEVRIGLGAMGELLEIKHV